MSSKRKQIDYDSDEKKKARTPPRTTLSTTNNVRPNVTLDALGLNPVVEMPWPGGTTRHPKTSVLKFAVVRELQQYLKTSLHHHVKFVLKVLTPSNTPIEQFRILFPSV